MSDYFFESGRVHVLEKRLVRRETIEQLLLAKDTEQLAGLLSECGVELVTDPVSGRLLREETLLGVLRAAYRDLGERVQTDPGLRLWLYPYDCNNVKAAIKGFYLGIDPREMMFDFGTVGVDEVIAMVAQRRFEGLPDEMACAAGKAIEAYAKNRNPQMIDLLVDAACFADMTAAAKQSKSAFVTDLVRLKIDLVNVMTLVRILRMQSGANGQRLLSDALIEGGTLSRKTLTEWFEGGEETLWDRVYHTALSDWAAAVVKTDKSHIVIERTADAVFMARVREARLIPVGIEPLVSFLIATEYDVRNLRIVIAGKEAGLDREKIRERIRDGYV